MKRPALTAERLRELLDYDMDSGLFTRKSRSGIYAAGSATGYVWWSKSGATPRPYTKVQVDGREHMAGALAWLYVYGEWPDSPIRFADGNGTNTALHNICICPPRPSLRSLPVKEAYARARDLLAYDANTGTFTSLTQRREKGPGLPIQTVPVNGYIYIRVDGQQLPAHQLAWLLATGRWPEGVIDHRDGNRANNAFKNLRDVTHAVNLQNQRRAKSDNRAGLLGAHLRSDTGRFASRIRAPEGVVYLGSFDTAEEAHEAYVVAKRRLHEGCTL